MTQLLQRAMQTYQARPGVPYTIMRTIPTGLAKPVVRIKVTIAYDVANRWPAGVVANYSLDGPQGTVQSGTFSGDIIYFRGNEVTIRGMDVTLGNNQQFLPGDYTLSFDVLQTAAASLLIEYFQAA